MSFKGHHSSLGKDFTTEYFRKSPSIKMTSGSAGFLQVKKSQFAGSLR